MPLPRVYVEPTTFVVASAPHRTLGLAFVGSRARDLEADFFLPSATSPQRCPGAMVPWMHINFNNY